MAGLATTGEGQALDITMKCAATLATTTAQYKVAFVYKGTTTADWTAEFPTSTPSNYNPLGIVQNYLTNGSVVASVRCLGVSKAYVYDSISVGDPVCAHTATAGDTYCGYVQSFSPKTDFTTAAVSHRVLGMALTGSKGATCTGSVITVLLVPSYDNV